MPIPALDVENTLGNKVSLPLQSFQSSEGADDKPTINMKLEISTKAKKKTNRAQC